MTTGGLDGEGTYSAADLPNHTGVWGYLSIPAVTETYDPEEFEEPVIPRYCLFVQPGYSWLPGRCRLTPGHEGEHDYDEINHAKLLQRRRDELEFEAEDIAGVLVNVWESDGGAA